MSKATGFAGGPDRTRWLPAHERQAFELVA
jgi:hypothetical protein